MDCRTTSTYKFRTRLGFKQYDVILTKQQSVLTKIISLFEGENMQTQYNFLNYRIDYNIKRQKAIEQEVVCKFIRTDPEAINKILRNIKQSTKNTLINKI